MFEYLSMKTSIVHLRSSLPEDMAEVRNLKDLSLSMYSPHLLTCSKGSGGYSMNFQRETAPEQKTRRAVVPYSYTSKVTQKQ